MISVACLNVSAADKAYIPLLRPPEAVDDPFRGETQFLLARVL